MYLPTVVQHRVQKDSTHILCTRVAVEHLVKFTRKEQVEKETERYPAVNPRPGVQRPGGGTHDRSGCRELVMTAWRRCQVGWNRSTASSSLIFDHRSFRSLSRNAKVYRLVADRDRWHHFTRKCRPNGRSKDASLWACTRHGRVQSPGTGPWRALRSTRVLLGRMGGERR